MAVIAAARLRIARPCIAVIIAAIILHKRALSERGNDHSARQSIGSL